MVDNQYLLDLHKELGDRIKYLRIKAGYNTKAELSKVYNTSGRKSTIIERYEKGANIEIRTIVQLANVLRMPVYCFFDFKNKFRVIISERYNYDIERRLTDVLIMIGKNIKRLRKEKSWSQLDLEVASSIDRGKIAHYELGNDNMKFDTLVILAKALNVEVLQLFRA